MCMPLWRQRIPLFRSSETTWRRSHLPIQLHGRCQAADHPMSSKKRKLSGAVAATKPSFPTKRARTEIPEYHQAEPVREDNGEIQWPAPMAAIVRAREIITECARANKDVVIVPDKDADGLSAGAILRHTLLLLGLSKDKIHPHLLTKGNSIHSVDEREQISSHHPSYVFVLDQGSRPGPPLIDGEHTGLIIDHHFVATAADFPERSEHVTACHSPPVATSALLTFELCKTLHPDVSTACDWLCVVGTHGDLGTSLKWEPPFPDMKAMFKQYSKKTLNDVVSLVNAPRRTATYDVETAWNALCDTTEPATVLQNSRLLAARAEVNAEVERCTHAAPKFSADGKVAVFRIKSSSQVHPVIATRWAGHLQSKSLEMVLVANEGYLPDKVNFSCRIPRCARGREPQVDIIQSLKAYASRPKPKPEADDDDNTETMPDGRTPLLERLGDDFARGHVQASGGIVATSEFEELMERMEIGVKPNKRSNDGPMKAKTKTIDPGQKNTLTSYFTKK